MAREVRSQQAVSVADGSRVEQFYVERDASSAVFSTPEEAEKWRDRLDDPADLGVTADEAWRATGR